MSLASATRAAVSATTNKASWRRQVAALACAAAAPHGLRKAGLLETARGLGTRWLIPRCGN